MPLVRRAENHVKLVLLGFGFLLWNEIIAPELLHVGAAPAQIIGLGVVRKVFPGIPAIHDEGDTPLLHVALAKRLVRFGFGLGQRREQHRRQDGDDGDDDQQFD